MAEKPGKSPEPRPEDGAPSAFGLDPAAMDAFERIAQELARAAAATQSALSSTVGKTSPADLDADPFKVGPDAVAMWGHLASDPVALSQAQMRLWEGYMNLWASAARRAAGEDAAPAVAPKPGDKRWKSEQWSDNPVLDVIKQSYLLTSHWLDDMVSQAGGLDDEARRRVSFFTRQLADAFAPTNFPLTNPDVMQEAIDTGGESVARGLRQLTEDIARGRGRLSISQTDYEKFKVGENVATAPGQVIFRNEVFELIQYAPTTEEVYERPLLIFPPWINKFYILDLREENSMIRWLTQQGFSVFLVSWVNPGPELKDLSFEDYMKRGLFEAIDATLEQSGAEKVNAVGYCIGGTLLLTSLAYMSQTKDDRIASATFFAAQGDFELAGELAMFVSDAWLEEIERKIDENGGVLDGQTMSDVFNMLRSNDLVWSFFVNNYLMGKTPKAFDLLYWNSDQTRLPKALHLFYLRNYYRDNLLSKGDLEIAGKRVALCDVDVPCYFQASREDHISPFVSVYRGAQRVGGKVRLTLSGSGHIAGVINHPDAKKYQHWTNSAASLPETPEEWLAGATETPGSWWPDWKRWLARRSGEKVPARDPEAGPLKPIEPAPGSYVKVRSDAGD